MAQYSGADVDGRQCRTDGVEVADVHQQRGGNDEVRHDVAVAVQLGADHGECRVTTGRRAGYRAVHDVRQARRNVQTHAQVVPATQVSKRKRFFTDARPKLYILPARRCSSACTSYGPVSVSACLSVTSRCYIEVDGRIELVLACRLLSTYPTLHWVVRKFRHLQKGTTISCLVLCV